MPIGYHRKSNLAVLFQNRIQFYAHYCRSSDFNLLLWLSQFGRAMLVYIFFPVNVQQEKRKLYSLRKIDVLPAAACAPALFSFFVVLGKEPLYSFSLIVETLVFVALYRSQKSIQCSVLLFLTPIPK